MNAVLLYTQITASRVPALYILSHICSHGSPERTPHTMNSHFAACSGRRMETLPAGLGRSLPGFAWSSLTSRGLRSWFGAPAVNAGALHELDFCLASTWHEDPAPASFCLEISRVLWMLTLRQTLRLADETDTPDASPPVGIGPRLLDVGIGPMPGTAPRPPMGRLGRGPIIIGGIGCGCK